MRSFQDTFETCKRLFISAFSICMAVLLLLPFDRAVLYGNVTLSFVVF